MWKGALGVLGVAAFLGAVIWAVLVTSYEADLGTNNVIEATFPERSTEGEDDVLATLRFQTEAEDLAWSSLDVELNINGSSVSCGFGSQSVPSPSDGLFQTKLGADGKTFTNVVDATNDEAFTHVSLPHQGLGNESNHTLRFSSTDVFLSSGVRWAFVEGVTLSEVTDDQNIEFSNDTDERLAWYEYDLSVHRVTPLQGVFVVEVESVTYKLQFVSYYNDNDERRYPTYLVAALDEEAFPALQDPTLVSPAPCLIVAGDGDVENWSATETVTLREHDLPLRSAGEPITLTVRYEGLEVRIVEIEPTEPEA